MKKVLYIANPNSIHDIKWISFFSTQPNQYKCYLLFEKNELISNKTITNLEELGIQVLPQIDPFSIRTPLKTIKSILILKNLEKTIQPDIIHVLFATPYALWINYISTKSAITLRGSDILKVIPSLLEQKGLKKYYFKWLYRKFEKSFKKSEFITCTSRSQEIKAKLLFPRINSHIIRTGIDIERITEAKSNILSIILPDNKKIILSPRYFSPIYNIELQLEAIELMDEKVLSSLFFVFIRGNNFDQTYYFILNEKLKYLERTKQLKYLILDQLDQEDLWALHHRADLCIMTPFSDGTPNSALEAMATKTPLIIPPLNYDSEIFDGTCLKLNHYNPKELELAIIRCLFSYDSNFIEAAWQSVKNYGNRTIEMKKLEKLYLKN